MNETGRRLKIQQYTSQGYENEEKVVEIILIVIEKLLRIVPQRVREKDMK